MLTLTARSIADRFTRFFMTGESRRPSPSITLVPLMLSIPLMLRIVLIDFPLMTLMVSMVLIGRSKFGANNRISLVEGLPDIMNLEIGDYVEFHVENGKLILRKETRRYYGLDFEGEEITERLIELQQQKEDELEPPEIDPDELIERAREMYERDKEAKAKKKL